MTWRGTMRLLLLEPVAVDPGVANQSVRGGRGHVSTRRRVVPGAIGRRGPGEPRSRTGCRCAGNAVAAAAGRKPGRPATAGGRIPAPARGLGRPAGTGRRHARRADHGAAAASGSLRVSRRGRRSGGWPVASDRPGRCCARRGNRSTPPCTRSSAQGSGAGSLMSACTPDPWPSGPHGTSTRTPTPSDPTSFSAPAVSPRKRRGGGA